MHEVKGCPKPLHAVLACKMKVTACIASSGCRSTHPWNMSCCTRCQGTTPRMRKANVHAKTDVTALVSFAPTVHGGNALSLAMAGVCMSWDDVLMGNFHTRPAHVIQPLRTSLNMHAVLDMYQNRHKLQLYECDVIRRVHVPSSMRGEHTFCQVTGVTEASTMSQARGTMRHLKDAPKLPWFRYATSGSSMNSASRAACPGCTFKPRSRTSSYRRPCSEHPSRKAAGGALQGRQQRRALAT